MGIAASFGGYSLQSCEHQKSGGSNALKQGRVCRGAEIRPPARTPKATRMAREPSGQKELKSSANDRIIGCRILVLPGLPLGEEPR